LVHQYGRRERQMKTIYIIISDFMCTNVQLIIVHRCY
jgi:hypothetical protein